MNCFFQDFAGSKLFIFLVGMSRWSNSWYNWSHLVGGHYSLFLLEWVYGRRKKRWVTISVEWPKAVFFCLHTHTPWNWTNRPWKRMVGISSFRFGFWLIFRCKPSASGKLSFCPRRHPVHAWNPSISPDARIRARKRDTWNWSCNVRISWYAYRLKKYTQILSIYIYIYRLYIIYSSNCNANK